LRAILLLALAIVLVATGLWLDAWWTIVGGLVAATGAAWDATSG
jgi:hypothetical protein